MPITPCPEVSNYPVVSYDRRGDATITIAVDVLPDEPEYFIIICVRDCVGCQHLRSRGATILMVMERINRALRLSFDSLVLARQ